MIRIHWRRVAAALSGLAACSVVACRDPVSPTSVTLRTNATQYVAYPTESGPEYTAYYLAIIATLRNDSDELLYVDRCDLGSSTPKYDVRRIDREESSFQPIWACPATIAFELPPGTERVDTLLLFSPTRLAGNTPIGRTEGAHQLLFTTSAGTIRSNAFSVLTPE